MKRSCVHLMLAAAAALAVLYGGYKLAYAGHSATPDAYYFLTMAPSDAYADLFYNWDHKEATGLPPFPGPNTVDWPVNMVFYNAAEIDLVKELYREHGGYATIGSCGSTKYLLFMGNNNPGHSYDLSGFFWDQDQGIKTNCVPTCVTGPAYHMRLYADPPSYPLGDRMYSTGLGFWIVGTTHKDANEALCGNKWHGRSEDAEDQRFVPDAQEICQFTVYPDYWYFYNRQYGSEIGDHIVQSNGWASYVNVRPVICL